MNQKVDEISEKLFRTKYEQLGEREKKVAHHLAERIHISRNVAKDFSEQLTFGQRLADKVATFGGSWIFIIDLCGCPGYLGFPEFVRSDHVLISHSIHIRTFC